MVGVIGDGDGTRLVDVGARGAEPLQKAWRTPRQNALHTFLKSHRIGPNVLRMSTSGTWSKLPNSLSRQVMGKSSWPMFVATP